MPKDWIYLKMSVLPFQPKVSIRAFLLCYPVLLSVCPLSKSISNLTWNVITLTFFLITRSEMFLAGIITPYLKSEMLHIHPPKIDSTSSFFSLVLVTEFRLTINRPENLSEYNNKTWNPRRISVYILNELCLLCLKITNSRIIILTSYKLKMSRC